MPHRIVHMLRARGSARRPVMLAIAGDSAAGKTTLTRGLVRCLGADRMTAVCVDDYHRYDRAERKGKPFTALNPACNHIDIMEQHLQLLSMGEPILKPVYDHATGELVRPELVEPRDFVIVEGLLPLHTRLSRACFDITVYLDPPEPLRHSWKIRRDCDKRGYTPEQVKAELARREPESAAYIRPQRRWADIVVRFAPVEGRHDPPGTPLSAELLLRPTIDHPDLATVVGEPGGETAMHLRLHRDTDGRPVDALHVHGYVSPEESQVVKKAIWERLGPHAGDGALNPEALGRLGEHGTSDPLAITQLLLLYHLLDADTRQAA
ncbi:phosphoribulokinase [Actinomadura sp. NBRC 104412]|uniref:phosphoribulokinase n=1 Tax=Actinomadura sp. NBRC 104412 TaxID=3032203 RepID=UPI00249FEC70|nr:phosphoribulokinase [Actinomadura sp. NBRC 104412]GLZ05868.1 phosphoribulokinase [Actinomadura sp. NBRC 104412]